MPISLIKNNYQNSKHQTFRALILLEQRGLAYGIMAWHPI